MLVGEEGGVEGRVFVIAVLAAVEVVKEVMSVDCDWEAVDC